MAFAQTQLRQLKRRLNRKWIKHRESNGQTLNYIEGWYAITEANRIFGFDGWDRETVGTQCVWAKPLGAKYGAAYVTRIKVTVRAGDQHVVREGLGAGEATAPSPGLAHEFAAKAAETDATKRALSTFGNMFGLSLYAGNGALPEPSPPIALSRLPIGRLSRDPSATSLPSLKGAPDPERSDPAATTPPDFDEARSPSGDRSFSSIPPWPDIDPFEEAAARAARSAPVEKSKLFRGEVQRLRDPGHLRYVAGLSCLVCGRKPSHAHHLRFAQPRALGRKVSDEFTVPLCNLHHREVHSRGNEEAWWQEKKLSPLAVAQELWATSRRHRGATALQAEFLRGNLIQSEVGDFKPDKEDAQRSGADENEAGS
jgi:Rad52/22 family double-strand break repair protein